MEVMPSPVQACERDLPLQSYTIMVRANELVALKRSSDWVTEWKDYEDLFSTGDIGPFLFTINPLGDQILLLGGKDSDPCSGRLGDRIVPGKDTVRFFEMNLQRVGDTDWPGASAISPK